MASSIIIRMEGGDRMGTSISNSSRTRRKRQGSACWRWRHYGNVSWMRLPHSVSRCLYAFWAVCRRILFHHTYIDTPTYTHMYTQALSHSMRRAPNERPFETCLFHRSHYEDYKRYVGNLSTSLTTILRCHACMHACIPFIHPPTCSVMYIPSIHP